MPCYIVSYKNYGTSGSVLEDPILVYYFFIPPSPAPPPSLPLFARTPFRSISESHVRNMHLFQFLINNIFQIEISVKSKNILIMFGIVSLEH